jgi:hypothetical protein
MIEGVVQVVELLLSNYEALKSISRTQNKKYINFAI